MDIAKAESEKMQRLAKEGKAITKIWRENFPKLSYLDVYLEIYATGERSSRGIKRMITTRLNAMADSTSKSERASIGDELHDLVCNCSGREGQRDIGES